MVQQFGRPFVFRILAVLFGLIVVTAPASAAMPRTRSPFFFPQRSFVPPQLRGFFNSPNFRVTFQPLGGGARVFMLSNGAQQARLVTQPLGGGAGVITFMNGATQARLVFQPLGGGARVVTFNSTGNITEPQLLNLTAGLNRSFVPVVPVVSPWAGMSAGAAMGSGYGGSGGYGGGTYISASSGGGGGESPPSYSPPQQRQSTQNTALNALGLPSQNGQLAWPMGLRVLPPDPQTKGLRREIEVSLVLVLQQAATNQDSSGAVKQAHDDISQLRHLLKENGTKLSEGMITEANRFLKQLDRAADKAATYQAATRTDQAGANQPAAAGY